MSNVNNLTICTCEAFFRSAILDEGKRKDFLLQLPNRIGGVSARATYCKPEQGLLHQLLLVRIAPLCYTRYHTKHTNPEVWAHLPNGSFWRFSSMKKAQTVINTGRYVVIEKTSRVVICSRRAPEKYALVIPPTAALPQQRDCSPLEMACESESRA